MHIHSFGTVHSDSTVVALLYTLPVADCWYVTL